MAKANEARLYDTEERPMSEEDRDRLDDELASVDDQILAVKDERSKVLANYRVSLRKLEDRQKVILNQRRDGVVEVKFEIVEVPDDDRLMVDIERKDTPERRVSTRQMTEPEKEAARKRKQGKLPLGDDDGIIDDADIPRDAVPSKAKKKGKAKR